MSKPINEPRMVQQALIADEDLSFELAALVPPANGITNAASTFIDRATKLLLSDKIMLTNEQHTAVVTAIAVAQLTVKEGAAVSKLLRNPDASADIIAGLDEAVTCCNRHTNQTKHQTAWYPTYAQIIVKGTSNDSINH